MRLILSANMTRTTTALRSRSILKLISIRGQRTKSQNTKTADNQINRIINTSSRDRINLQRLQISLVRVRRFLMKCINLNRRRIRIAERATYSQIGNMKSFRTITLRRFTRIDRLALNLDLDRARTKRRSSLLHMSRLGNRVIQHNLLRNTFRAITDDNNIDAATRTANRSKRRQAIRNLDRRSKRNRAYKASRYTNRSRNGIIGHRAKRNRDHANTNIRRESSSKRVNTTS